MVTWDKATIQSMLDNPFGKTGTIEHKKVVLHALIALYNRQTQDEQHTESTNHNNNRGFNGTDARWCTFVAKLYQQKGYLSNETIAKASKRLRKYAGQLESEAANRAASL